MPVGRVPFDDPFVPVRTSTATAAPCRGSIVPAAVVVTKPYFKVIERFNTKAKLTTRKALGFRTYHMLDVASYHTFGALPEPPFTHKFC